ncbi:hypothetical protein JTE90_027607 [Oedothorax gibbosus]|uniref:Uncharacterized protein n=1 Tax=Oedothorax gibbosus TaxID=931172 RepID=A0AAV6VKB3_9ARAC|nr:hypothetical protein JTE90_027607 [Oedothorax gibbosus]
MNHRRIVEGWMGDRLYRSLGNEPDVELAWKKIRGLVGHHLFESEYVTVPHFDSTIYYNQMFVFKKKRSLLSCLGFEPPTYKVVGNLDYLVDQDVSTWVPQFDFSPWDVADGLDMYKEYRLNVISDVPGGEIKSIRLVVLGLHARAIPPITPGSLKIHMNLVEDLDRVKRLYIIDEVVFASYIRLNVCIGTEEKTVVYDFPSTPIGFSYRKYSVSPEGEFLREITTTLRICEDATWIRPEPQPVPWCYPSHRPYSTAKKTRSNFTIPTLGDEGRNRRRAWALQAGELRDTRSQVNVNNNAQDDQDPDTPRHIPVRNPRIPRVMAYTN